jgi:hypothetical protein
LVRFQMHLVHFANSLEQLVGARRDHDSSIFDLYGTDDDAIDWGLTHQFQDGMLLFILLHECAHHALGHIQEDVEAFLAHEDNSNSLELSSKEGEYLDGLLALWDRHSPLKIYSKGQEFEADKTACLLWFYASSNYRSGETDWNFELDFLQNCGGSPLLLYSLLQYGYELYRPEKSKYQPGASHPSPAQRYSEIANLAKTWVNPLNGDNKINELLNAANFVMTILKNTDKEGDPF